MVVEVQRKLIDVGSEVRQLSHDLYPPMLKQAGLAEVLRGYCDAFGHSRGIAASCDVDESVADLSPGTALALYRIAQEALGNAAKHAAPTRVDVRLLRIGGDVVLTVADDGQRLRARAGRRRRPRARQHARARAPAGRHVRAGQPARARHDGAGRRPVPNPGSEPAGADRGSEVVGLRGPVTSSASACRGGPESSYGRDPASTNLQF